MHFISARNSSATWPTSKLVPLEGEEIGQLIARAVEASAVERRPWYGPMDELPREPLISRDILGEFDTLVVELPPEREIAARGEPAITRALTERANRSPR